MKHVFEKSVIHRQLISTEKQNVDPFIDLLRRSSNSMMVYSTIVFLLTILKLSAGRNIHASTVQKDLQAVESIVLPIPSVPLMSPILNVPIATSDSLPITASVVSVPEVTFARGSNTFNIPTRGTSTTGPHRILTATEAPVRWCGEDEDNEELTLADLEVGSGSEELPPAIAEQWRKNHPDEQFTDDDSIDSFELEHTRIEVLL